MDKKGLLGRLALFATAFIWGTSFVIMKGTLDNMSPLWTVAVRFSMASILLGILAIKKIKVMSGFVLKGSIYMGICLAAAYIVQTYGLVYTTPGKNAFLTATYCVLVPFMAWGIYKRKPTAANIVGAVLCIFGIGLVSLEQGFHDVNIGDMLTLCCGIFYAFQIIMMEHYSAPDTDALAISAVQFAAASVLCLVFALIFEPVPADVSAQAWLNLVYLGVMCTAVCFFLQAWGMKYTPSAPAAVIQTFESVFGAMISVMFYGEAMTLKLFIGFALIFLSVVVSETNPKLFGKNKA